ncbi:hypothetical protein STEG23_032730 [Scotinomys teguina]
MLPLWRLIRYCLKEGKYIDILHEGRRALSAHQDSMSESDNKEKGNLKEERPKSSKASSKLLTKVEKEKKTDQGKKEKETDQGKVKQKSSGLYPVLDEFKQKHSEHSGLYPVLDEFSDLTLSDSAEDELESEEEKDSEEAATVCERERYCPEISAKELTWTYQEGQEGKFQPFVVELPITLWGRDVLSQMKFMLTTEYSEASQNMMKNSGFIPGKGLGKCLQGIAEPIITTGKQDHKEDCCRFAFTLPSINHEQPDTRYQWRVLPQGMANSPTMCQLFVHQALLPTRKEYLQVRIIYYMDDILLAAPSQDVLDKTYAHTVQALEKKGLYIAPEKVQKDLIDNHYPKDNLLLFITHHPVIFPKVTVMEPLKGAIEIYTDGSKSGIGAYLVKGQEPVKFQFQPNTPQIVECQIVYEVFKRFHEPFNLLSDLHYVVNAVRGLETSAFIKESSPVHDILWNICVLIRERKTPFFIGHIRAHTLLPGPMTAANDLVDKATRVFAAVELDSISMAKQFHQLYYVPAHTLCFKFKISRQLARDIVKACSSCVQFLHPPHVGINPRGLRPGDLWQMDVTHIPSFGKLSYVHVSVDTCSGVIFASPLIGEKVTNVISHCLEAWAAWGKPLTIKTDNGPAYISKSFQQFCLRMQVRHVTGLPYNPQGQGIVERANRSLKELLHKQKGGIAEGYPPKNRLSLALYTLNFLNLNDKGVSAASRHSNFMPSLYSDVKWKDVLNNQWHGPDPVISRSRGAVCVFPQDQENPIWIPERLTRFIRHEDPDPDTSDKPDSSSDQSRTRDAVLGSDQDVADSDASAC